MARSVSIFDVSGLPFWRKPIFLLFIMAVAMPIAFNVWSALLNNFVVQVADFDGSDIGLLHTVREVPGFLAVGVILLLLVININIPNINLAVYCTTSQDQRVLWMECKAGYAIWYIDVHGWFKWVEISPKNTEDRNNTLMLTP